MKKNILKQVFSASFKAVLIGMLAVLHSMTVSAQDGTWGLNLKGNQHSSAVMQIDADNKGLLVPRISLKSVSEISPITVEPANGLLVFNVNPNMTGGNGVGFYYWNAAGKKWASLISTLDDNPIQQSIMNVVHDHLLNNKGTQDTLAMSLINQSPRDTIISIVGDALGDPGGGNNPIQQNIMNVVHNHLLNNKGTQDTLAMSLINQSPRDTIISIVGNALIDDPNNPDDNIIQQNIMKVVNKNLPHNPETLDSLAKAVATAPVRDTIINIIGNAIWPAQRLHIRVVQNDDITISDDDYTIIIKGSTKDLTLHLPEPSRSLGRVLAINQYNADKFTVNTDQPLQYSATQGAVKLLAAPLGGGFNTIKLMLQCDGSQWYVVASQSF